ncbi:MAG: RNA 2',3'-cyclic phosphodiesterase [Burkholderiales bacterium]
MPEKSRLFFALWPDDSIRKSLAATAATMNAFLRGRATREENLHLTLVFLGDVHAAKIPALLSPAAPSALTFNLLLDHWGCWAHNGIGWVAPSDIPGPLAGLVDDLATWLGKMGYVLERRAYRPHVTLVRKARAAALPDLPATIIWPVREFVLLQSRQDFADSKYEILGRWPLG